MKRKLTYFFVLFLIVGLLISLFFIFVSPFKQTSELWWREKSLPKPIIVISSSTNQQLNNGTIGEKKNGKNFQNNEREEKSVLPAEINLFVPFATQAPFKNWDKTHEETCEEAAVLMIYGFYNGVKKYLHQEIEESYQKTIEWEKKNFGYFEDTTVEETAEILSDFYSFKNVKVYYDITVDDIKKAVAEGRPVILPTAGKILPNPYFRNGGPLYHMLVVKGYTQDGRFITNDPGTNTLGENLTYRYADLYRAIHDWRPDREILKGRKAMIVIE